MKTDYLGDAQNDEKIMMLCAVCTLWKIVNFTHENDANKKKQQHDVRILDYSL